MSKCPFWSTGKEKIECYDECPMNTIVLEEESCPFREYLSDAKMKFKDIVGDDFAYSSEDYEDSIIGFNFKKESSNY